MRRFAIFLLGIVLSGCAEHPQITTIHSRSGYEVRIFGERTWEYQEAYYFEVWREKRRVQKLTFFDAGPRRTYTVTESDNGRTLLLCAAGESEPVYKIELTNAPEG